MASIEQRYSSDSPKGESTVEQTGGLQTSQPYIHLEHLSPVTDLPPHGALDNDHSQLQPGNLTSAILSQALEFMDAVLPTFEVKKDAEQSKPSSASVQLLSLQRGKEAWFARRSRHKDQQSQGTADWNEFDTGLRVDHSVHEMEYTPDVIDAYSVCDWPIQDGLVEGWREVTCEVREMVHHIPFPLQPRVFSVLVVTATSTELRQSIVVQIPVDLQKASGALYTTGLNTSDKAPSGLSSEQKKKMVLGEYVSIERLRSEQTGDEILWEMATASDAKGNLPMAVQKMGTPGAVVKDVGLFLDWTAKRREGK